MARHIPLRRRRLRPARADDLGVRRALADRLLPFLVAAMAFLAALALAGAVAADRLAQHWRGGGTTVLTVQVPDPGSPGDAGSRVARVAALLRADPGVAAVRLLGEQELEGMLRPWLGGGDERIALPLPAVLEVRMRAAEAVPDRLTERLDANSLAARLDANSLAARLDAATPGTLVDDHGAWLVRLGTLARSLQACAALATAVVACVAAAVVAVATRAGLSARRDAIAVVHGLGATDGYIAKRFARRATALAAAGAVLGTLAAVPLLASLAQLAAPFAMPGAGEADGVPGLLPLALWVRLAALPLAAAAIGWLTAQGTVRSWLLRLP